MSTTMSRPARTVPGDARAKRAGKTTAAAARKRRAGITAMAAAERVLRAAPGPMRVSDIAAAAVKLRAFQPTGKTPAQSVAARVHVSASTPGGTFVRVDRGVVDLRELNPRGARKRPAAKAVPAREQDAAS